MNDVVSLQAFKDRNKATDPVYGCECGSQIFTLRPRGLVECAECEGPHDKLLWAQHFVSKAPSDE